MKWFVSPQNLRRATLFLATGAVFLAVAGCGDKGVEGTSVAAGGKPSAGGSTDAQLKQGFQQKFDINNVPPDQRARVEALMKNSQSSAASAPKASGTDPKK